MNEEKLNQLLDFLVTTLHQAKDFTAEQAPQVVKEFLAFEVWNTKYNLGIGCASVGIGFLLVIASYFARLKANQLTRSNCDYDFLSFIAGAFAIIALLIGVITLCINFKNLKQIEIAPRVYMLQKLGVVTP